MTTTISGTSGIQTPSLDLTTPLPVTEGGTGTSTVKPYRMVLGTPIATTSGTSHDFTSLPTWVKKITVMLNGVSTNGTSVRLLQIGDSSGLSVSGYACHAGAIQSVSVNSADHTTGFGLSHDTTATDTIQGSFVITKIDTNIYTISGSARHSNTRICFSAGSKTLSGVLDRIRLTTVNGTDTFDAGSFNIIYEGYED